MVKTRLGGLVVLELVVELQLQLVKIVVFVIPFKLAVADPVAGKIGRFAVRVKQIPLDLGVV
jgi:hypothetical protein